MVFANMNTNVTLTLSIMKGKINDQWVVMIEVSMDVSFGFQEVLKFLKEGVPQME